MFFSRGGPCGAVCSEGGAAAVLRRRLVPICHRNVGEIGPVAVVDAQRTTVAVNDLGRR